MIRPDKKFFTRYTSEFIFYFGFLTILGLAFFLQTIYSDSASGQTQATQSEIVNVFVDRLVSAYLWLALTPVIIFVVQRIHFGAKNIFLKTVLHVLSALSFTLIHIIIYSLYVYGIHAAVPGMYVSVFEKMNPTMMEYIIGSIPRVNHVYRLLYYCIIIAIHFAFEYFRRYSERELQASQLEVQLKEAQLNTLQKQLQPHFLFNTLNSISSLMYSNVDQADKMLTSLGDLLRISLERMELQEIRLSDDISFLEKYLHIEQTRLGSRMTLHTNFSPESLDALVPCMITQPIVENAIKHGIANQTKNGSLSITSSRNGETLCIIIEDSGPGIAASIDSVQKHGLGIKNTIERLSHLYGDHYALTFSNRNEGGLRVTMCMPFRIQQL